MVDAEVLARMFHEAHERLAPKYGRRDRNVPPVPWADVPAADRRLMVATCSEVLAQIRLT